MERRSARFPIMLTKQEDEAIQAYRFGRQIGTKAEAVRILIRKGLEAEKMATTGVEFGDQSPADAPSKTDQEIDHAGRT